MPLYNAILLLLQPLYNLKLNKRAKKEPLYSHDISARFGHYRAAYSKPNGTKLIWIHAVSLGEVHVAKVLIAHIRPTLPNAVFLITTGTATGYAAATSLLHGCDVQTWLPWDTRAGVRRFLKHFQPDIGVLIETEVWPRLIFECVKHAIPIVLANARMSKKTLEQTQKAHLLMRPVYTALTQTWAQTPSDAARLQQLGAQNIHTMGNLKFDFALNIEQIQAAQAIRQNGFKKSVVLFASSREGEEIQFLKALKELLNSDIHSENFLFLQSITWIIVPRHPQRFDDVDQMIQKEGFLSQRRSKVSNLLYFNNEKYENSSDTSIYPLNNTMPSIVLGDTIGEMAFYYSLSDVTLLGASFEPLGGQNLIEACAYGSPVIMGEHTFNFETAAQDAIAHDAAQRVRTMAQALSCAVQYLQKPRDVQQAFQQKAKTFAQSQQGAAQRMVHALATILTT